MDTSLLARGGTPIDLDRPRILFFDKTAAWELRQKFGPRYKSVLFTATVNGENVDIELKSMDALESFLFAGLRCDAAAHGETLTLAQVGDWIMPATEENILYRVVTAFTRSNYIPPLPGDSGKADAAAARPAVVAAKTASRKVSTLRKPSASRSRASTKRPRSSGRKP